MTSLPVQCETRELASGRCLGIATLDSERSLNALTLDMVDCLLPHLAAWAADERVVMVLLRGRGERAFCAGGDVRRLTEFARSGEGDALAAGHFFAREYRLDYAIHQFPKPLLVWGSGIVMGGGMGLWMGARFRVVTETTRMAMPEISIGLFPDVGGSYFLSRLPGRFGLYLGLTAQHFNGADALALGLATDQLSSSDWQPLLDDLAGLAWSADAAEHADQVQAVLRARASSAPASALLSREDVIEAVCAHADLVTLDAVWRDVVPEQDWLAKAMSTYRAGSPTSAALVWQQWHRGSRQSLAQVFRDEWRIATHCAARHDFPEGVRALLIDKDQQPRWQPATLAEVTPAWLAGFDQVPAGHALPLDDLEACYGS